MHSMNSLLFCVFLSLGTFACNASDSITIKPEKNVVPEDKAIDSYLQKAMQADAIMDPVKRCIAYPDMPGVSWEKQVVVARCRLLWTPEYTLMRIDDLLDETDGERNLDDYFTELLRGHYDTPAKRDLIFAAFDVFKGSGAAAETAAAWLAANPDSAYAQLAAGVQKEWAAGVMRGSDSYSATPEHRIEKMRRLVEEASVHLTRALELEPTLSPACVALLDGAKIASGDSDIIAKRCVEMDPYSFTVVNSWKNSVEPRWGGSEEEIQQVVDHINQHSDKNPALQSLNTMIAGYTYTTIPYESLGEFQDQLFTIVKIAPTSRMFEKLSMAYGINGHRKLALAAQSQAVRFEMSAVSARRSRMFSAIMTMPTWSLMDAEEQVRRYPNYAQFRIDRKLAQGFVALEKSGRLASMNKDGFNYSDAGINGMESRNATIQDECMQFNAVGRRGDLGTGMLCEDDIIKDAPTDPNAWRVRAEVARQNGETSASLEAAKQYLQLADPTDPAFEMNKKRFERWLSRDKQQPSS